MDTLLAPAGLIFFPQNLWLWIAISVLMAALVNSFAWRARRSNGKLRSGLFRWLLAALIQAGRFLYFVWLPYAALLAGLVPVTQMGLMPQDWLTDLSLALPLSLGAVLVLLLMRYLVLWQTGDRTAGPAMPWGVALRESFYQEVHWAFYRSAPLLVWPDRWQGLALGLGLVALEAWLDPHWRARWRDPVQAAAALRNAAIAVLMAAVFMITDNFWVTLGVHVLAERITAWAWERIGEGADAAAWPVEGKQKAAW
ncbi:MAG: hypothetical protein ACOYZ7_16060 [Chloroflexota bacterium]